MTIFWWLDMSSTCQRFLVVYDGWRVVIYPRNPTLWTENNFFFFCKPTRFSMENEKLSRDPSFWSEQNIHLFLGLLWGGKHDWIVGIWLDWAQKSSPQPLVESQGLHEEHSASPKKTTGFLALAVDGLLAKKTGKDGGTQVLSSAPFFEIFLNVFGER